MIFRRTQEISSGCPVTAVSSKRCSIRYECMRRCMMDSKPTCRAVLGCVGSMRITRERASWPVPASIHDACPPDQPRGCTDNRSRGKTCAPMDPTSVTGAAALHALRAQYRRTSRSQAGDVNAPAQTTRVKRLIAAPLRAQYRFWTVAPRRHSRRMQWAKAPSPSHVHQLWSCAVTDETLADRKRDQSLFRLHPSWGTAASFPSVSGFFPGS